MGIMGILVKLIKIYISFPPIKLPNEGMKIPIFKIKILSIPFSHISLSQTNCFELFFSILLIIPKHRIRKLLQGLIR